MIGQRPRHNYPSSHHDCLRKWSLEYFPSQGLSSKFIYSLALASEENSYTWLLCERWHLRSLPPLIHVLRAFPMIQRVTFSSSHQPLHSAATEAASGLPQSLSICGYLQRLLDDRSRLPRTKQYVYSTREAAKISANDRIKIANDAPWQSDSQNKSLQERSPWSVVKPVYKSEREAWNKDKSLLSADNKKRTREVLAGPLDRRRNKQKKQAEKQSRLEFSSEPVLPCDRVLSRMSPIQKQESWGKNRTKYADRRQPIVNLVLTRQVYRHESRTTLGKRDIYAH